MSRRVRAATILSLIAVVILFGGLTAVPASAQESMSPGTGVPTNDLAMGSGSGGSVLSVGRGIMGLAALIGLAWLLSHDRRRTPWKLVGMALVMQVGLGLCLIKLDVGRGIFQTLANGATALLGFSVEGTKFVFGQLGAGTADPGAIAFYALPTIVFFSCLMSVLYHLRIMQVFIWVLAKIMSRLLGVTGAESMAMAANVFVGQTEAPLVIRRYVPTMTRSELMSLMTGGFATVAGSVLAVYIGFLQSVGGEALVPHLLIASVMSAPAAFAISKIILPESEKSATGGDMKLDFKPTSSNILDAAATGTTEGLKLLLNVVAMLIAFVAMVRLIDFPLGWIGSSLDIEGGLSLSRLFGFVFGPLAYLMGVEGADIWNFGALLGMKIGVNEFFAYDQLKDAVALHNAGGAGAMSRRSIYMATYALCGFANFASIGIQIGGISPLAPERRQEIIGLAFRAMCGGALASWMTASVAGMFF